MIKGVLIAILVVLILAVSYLTYFVFINFYSNPLKFNVNYNESEIMLINSSAGQFYANMRFKTNNISYSFGSECPIDKIENMVKAFRYLENRTGKISFFNNEPADIEIRCGKEYEKAGLFVAGEGGPVSIINGSLFNVILKGQILLLYSESCSFNVELHELLHVLGFQHSENPKSILYNLSSCDQVLGEDIVQEIVRFYNIESLPDLYFLDISAIKRGNYLNLNFSVRNQGLDDAENVSVKLISDSDKEESFNVGSIEVGAGRIYSVENLKIPLRTKTMKLVIFDGKELDDRNNEVSLSLE